jgi:hypothetical protein
MKQLPFSDCQKSFVCDINSIFAEIREFMKCAFCEFHIPIKKIKAIYE